MFNKLLITAAVLGFLTSGASAATLIPPGDNPGGQSASISAMQWMQWAYSFDNAVDGSNPIDDSTGAYQNMKQTYPVFMLGGGTETGVTRSFSMEVGKPLAIPLVNVACVSSAGFDCTDTSVIDFIDGFMADVDRLYLKIDDDVLIDADTAAEVDAIEDLYRVTSPFFHLEVAPNNWGGEPAGTWPNSYVDGFFAFAEELPVGEHSIVFEGGGPFGGSPFYVGVEADVRVVPIPAALPLLLGGLAALGVMARPRRQPKA